MPTRREFISSFTLASASKLIPDNLKRASRATSDISRGKDTLSINPELLDKEQDITDNFLLSRTIIGPSSEESETLNIRKLGVSVSYGIGTDFGPMLIARFSEEFILGKGGLGVDLRRNGFEGEQTYYQFDPYWLAAEMNDQNEGIVEGRDLSLIVGGNDFYRQIYNNYLLSSGSGNLDYVGITFSIHTNVLWKNKSGKYIVWPESVYTSMLSRELDLPLDQAQTGTVV